MDDVIRKHIEIVEGARGPKARIAGHRIRVVDIVVWHEKLGISPDRIVHDYAGLTLADVHAALAYYWDNRDAIEAAIEADQQLYDELRQRHPSRLQELLQSRA